MVPVDTLVMRAWQQGCYGYPERATRPTRLPLKSTFIMHRKPVALSYKSTNIHSFERRPQKNTIPAQNDAL